MPGSCRVLVPLGCFILLFSVAVVAQTTGVSDQGVQSEENTSIKVDSVQEPAIDSAQVPPVPPSVPQTASQPPVPLNVPPAEVAKPGTGNPVKPMEELTPPPVPHDLDSANDWFEQNNFSLATRMFEGILHDNPKIKNVAEIKYKIAVGHYFQNHTDKAQEMLFQLASNHYSSPWAKLVLVSHFDEKNFSKFLNEVYSQARDKKAIAEAQKVMELISLYVKRFPPNDAKKHEMMYKGGVSLLILGNTKEFQNGLALLKEKAANTGWTTMVECRLGDQATFEKKMEDLINLTGVDGENNALFQELAGEYYPRLQGESRAKCRFLQARCLEEKDRATCVAFLKEIIQQHPKSPWAGEATFWLAEYTYREGKHEEAKRAFLEFSQKHPKSSRAAQAKEWARWIDQRKQFENELSKVLVATLTRFQKEPAGIAANLKLHLVDKNQTLNAQFAIQKKRLLVNVRFKNKALYLASNDKGTWFLSPDQKSLYRTRDKQMPIPQFFAELDPAEKKFAFNFGTSGEENASPLVLKLPPNIISANLPKVCDYFHGRVETKNRPDGKQVQVFHVEAAHRDADYFPILEMETEEGFIREIRVKVHENGKQLAWITLEGIRLAEPLEEHTFNLPAMPHVEIRDMEEINFWEVYGHVMQFASNLFQEIDWKKYN